METHSGASSEHTDDLTREDDEATSAVVESNDHVQVDPSKLQHPLELNEVVAQRILHSDSSSTSLLSTTRSF
jgi:hypothetical protein